MWLVMCAWAWAAEPTFSVKGIAFGDDVVQLPWAGCQREGDDSYWCPTKLGPIDVVYRLVTSQGKLVRYVVYPAEMDNQAQAADACRLLVGGVFAAMERPDYTFPIDENATSRIHLWKRGDVEIVSLQKQAPTGCWLHVQWAKAPLEHSAAERAVGQALLGE